MKPCMETNVLDEETHFRVRQQLKRRGLSLTAIADRLGVTPNAVSVVSSGRAVSRKITDEIARTLEKTPAELWPHRYQEADDDVV